MAVPTPSYSLLSSEAETRLLFFFLGLVATFLFIRLSVRMIRANVRWWPGNVTPGGLHIHHVVFGIVLMALSGVTGLVLDDDASGWRIVMSAAFGVGTALVLDEFALVLHLKDVYWTQQGRLSVDAVCLAIGLVGLLLLSGRPLGIDPPVTVDDDGTTARLSAVVALLYGIPILLFIIVTLLKGKIWSGLFGIFIPVLPIVGAIRLARPGSPWAKWCYRPDSAKRALAVHREVRTRRSAVRFKIWAQEFIAGKHDVPAQSGPPHAEQAKESEQEEKKTELPR